MYRNRTLETSIQKLSQSFPVLLLTGPRQVGKTTMLEYLARLESPARHSVTLDDFGPRRLANEDPELFLERYRPPLIIDEIQYAPALLPRIKALVDRNRASGLYWLTGSQHFPLMQGVSESLAGRVVIVRMLGLSQEEEFPRQNAQTKPFRPDRAAPSPSKFLSPDAVFTRIVRGAFPRLIHPDAPPSQAFHGSYLQTYIERDLRNIANIANLSAFETFLRLAAARVGQLLNLSDLARDAQIAVSTARQWLSVLETSFQAYLLKPYFGNIGKRQTKTPKLYFLDTGLACYLTGWHTAEVAARGAMAGNLFENYVVAELVKSYWHRGLDAPLWFWRTKEKVEVDVIIDEEGTLFPVEIKTSMRPDSRAAQGIEALRRQHGSVGPGAVVCLAEERLPLTREIDIIPIAHL